MLPRRGFTLIEVMLAIALTGIVALLVYGAAGVAVDTRARLVDRERELRSERAWHVVVEDALRNLRPNADSPRPTLILSQGSADGGSSGDRLEFVTAGGTPPLTGDADWRVTLETVNGRIVLTAQPIGVRAPARRIIAPPNLTGLAVRVFGGAGDLQWLAEWREPRLLPEAIELVYRTETGPMGPPILMAVSQENGP